MISPLARWVAFARRRSVRVAAVVLLCVVGLPVLNATVPESGPRPWCGLLAPGPKVELQEYIPSTSYGDVYTLGASIGPHNPFDDIQGYTPITDSSSLHLALVQSYLACQGLSTNYDGNELNISGRTVRFEGAFDYKINDYKVVDSALQTKCPGVPVVGPTPPAVILAPDRMGHAPQVLGMSDITFKGGNFGALIGFPLC